MNMRNFGRAAGAGGIGAGLYGLFGDHEDPAEEGMNYINQIPDAISPYFNPYIQSGNRQIPELEKEYGELTSNPGEKLNDISSGYKQSPGFKFALQQALQGAGHAAAAGGMAGSPQHEFQNMEIGTQLGNQDFHNWLDKALGLYGTGVSGKQGMLAGGQKAGQSLADQISQALASKAKLGYEGAISENQRKSSAFDNLAGGAATLAAFI